MKTALAEAIKRDLLAEDTGPKASACTCFACGRGYLPRKPRDQDDNTRFCSKNCQDAYDTGTFRPYEERSGKKPWLWVDLSRCVQIAGTPIPKCDACGGLCVELHRKAGKNYCHWRCRDGKPRDCQSCGANLYGIPRRGPYCSDRCAQAPRKRNVDKIRVSEG